MYRAGLFAHFLLKPGDEVLCVRYWKDVDSRHDGVLHGTVRGFRGFYYKDGSDCVEVLIEADSLFGGGLCHQVVPYGC